MRERRERENNERERINLREVRIFNSVGFI